MSKLHIGKGDRQDGKQAKDAYKSVASAPPAYGVSEAIPQSHAHTNQVIEASKIRAKDEVSDHPMTAQC
jgi:hypothetical protein